MPTFAVMLPALPALLVLVARLALSRLRVGVIRVTCPALPAPVVELVMLLLEAKLTVLSNAVIVMFPASPVPELAAETLAPLSIVMLRGV